MADKVQSLEEMIGEVLNDKTDVFTKKTAPLHVRSEDTLPVHSMPVIEHGILPKGVDSFIRIMTTEQDKTIRRCLEIAEQLETAAQLLRNRAAIIGNQSRQIPEDIRQSVLYERESSALAASWQFVNPRKEHESPPKDSV